MLAVLTNRHIRISWLLGSTNPVHWVLKTMYCSCHVVCLGRSASRSKHRVICAFFGDSNLVTCRGFLKSFCFYSPSGGSRRGARGPLLPLIFRPNRGPKRRTEYNFFLDAPPPLIWRSRSTTTYRSVKVVQLNRSLCSREESGKRIK